VTDGRGRGSGTSLGDTLALEWSGGTTSAVTAARPTTAGRASVSEIGAAGSTSVGKPSPAAASTVANHVGGAAIAHGPFGGSGALGASGAGAARAAAITAGAAARDGASPAVLPASASSSRRGVDGFGGST
jgi:hypothetical protein